MTARGVSVRKNTSSSTGYMNGSTGAWLEPYARYARYVSVSGPAVDDPLSAWTSAKGTSYPGLYLRDYNNPIYTQAKSNSVEPNTNNLTLVFSPDSQ